MSAVALGWDRTRLELKQYFREWEAVVFNFAFPIVFLALFAVIFSGNFDDAGEMTAARFFLPGMIAAGVLLSSFQTMALSVATERDDGTLKRLRGTPMPPLAYFLGKIGLVVITSLIQFGLLLVVARVVYGVELPTDAERWGRFAMVFVLGIAGGTALGIAYSSLASSARTAGAIVIMPALILQFISGVYFPFNDLPEWMQQAASIFPLKWIAQGMRSVFFPDGMAGQEMAGAWETGRTLIILGTWAMVGLIICATTFRWTRRQ
ncbi:ABC transporter permease [Janibacter sp. GXQ6167]|uniref:ABC transporter permease n=1 Tax=Janibacter sp. GXQ6167 TaxID=3240791 RepID=UPI003524B1E1